MKLRLYSAIFGFVRGIKTKKHIFWIGALTASLFYTLSVSAQQYPFKKIGLEQGLPSARINDIIEDSRGFFWLATDGAGLVRYDGFEFVSFSDEEDPSSLLVNNLAEDGKGKLWLSLEQGIAAFDGIEFEEYKVPDDEERILKVVASGSLVRALGRAGNLFVPEDGHLEKDTRWTKVANDISFSGDSIYFATSEGIYSMHYHDGLPRLLNSLSTKAISIDSKILVGRNSGIDELGKQQGLLLGESVKKVFIRGTTSIALLEQGGLWYSRNDKSEVLGTNNGLPNENYKGCYIDAAGVFWLYSDNGITQLESTALEFFNQTDGIEGSVLSTFIDSQNRLYAGTNKGLRVVSGEEVKQFNLGPVLAIGEYGGLIWLGTEKGLMKFDGASFEPFQTQQLQGVFVFSLLGSEDGLWISTGRGLFRYAKGSLVNMSSKNNLPYAPAFAISKGKDGSIWFATYAQGLIKYQNDEWAIIQEYNEMRLDTVRFSTFTAIDESSFWMGNLTEGLYLFTPEREEHIPASELDFAEIQSLSIDAQEALWAGTNKGLFHIVKSSESFAISRIGIVGETMPNACYTKKGVLSLGTSEGLQKVDIKEWQAPKPLPKLQLTDVSLFLEDSDTLKNYMEKKEPFSQVPIGLRLPYNMDFLSFNLSGLTGYQNEKLQYRYRLKGQSENWTQAGDRREAIFSNIKPGSYQFEAQVARRGEAWSTEIVSYSFKILRPYWRTWWFILSISIVVLGLSFWFTWDRIKRFNQRLQLENDLLDMERKALRLQMNPHFIFNALDSISSFIFKNDPKQAVKYLNNFAKLMRLTLESSMEHLHPVETEVSILKNYLELEKLRFKGKFEFFFEVDEEIDYDVGIPPMLIQPHVENAILHGLKPMESDGLLYIRFSLEDDFLICQVEDNGIGRKRSKQLPKRTDHRSMATQINKDRLRLLKLSMSEDVEIKIIDKEQDNKPLGTKVVIKLPAESI